VEGGRATGTGVPTEVRSVVPAQPKGLGLTELLLRHLADIGGGRCELTEEVIAGEQDEDVRELLMGLRVLHDDLEVQRGHRQLVDAEREELLAESARAIHARDEFLSIGAHELRTPLTSLRLQVELTQRTATKLEPADPVRTELEGRLDVLRRQLTRMEVLVTELLDVARLNSGRMELHPEPLDVAEVAREVIARFGPEVEQQGLALSLHGPQVLTAHMDRLRLEAVLTNLISNAVRYGNGKPVQVELRERGSRVELLVIDQGLGITPEEQGRLFQPFSRLMSGRTMGGLGLGLWIVRNVVEAMGGGISLDSQRHRGSRFKISLPRD